MPRFISVEIAAGSSANARPTSWAQSYRAFDISMLVAASDVWDT